MSTPTATQSDDLAPSVDPQRAELLRLRREVAALTVMNEHYLSIESELEERTQDLKLILASSGDVFLTVDFGGSLQGPTTARAQGWFGRPGPQTKVWDYLYEPGSVEAMEFEIGFEQLAGDVLPFEVSSGQMPKRVRRGESEYEISYREVIQRGRRVRLLLVVRDMTAQVAAECSEARAREFHAIVSNILRDRRDFRRFVADAAILLEAVCACDEAAAQLRNLHTLKGDSATFGLRSFAALVHRFEQDISENAEPLSRASRARLREAWAAELDAVADFIDVDRAEHIEVAVAEHDAVLMRLEGSADLSDVAARMRAWRDDPVAVPLRRLARHAERLAERLGCRLDVTIDHGGIRMPLDRTGAFWSNLVHLVRNAVDHGIEAPQERVAAGKDACGHLRITCSQELGDTVVTIADDGRGIDWSAVAVRAHAMGLPAATPADLVELLFAEGVTTRSEVTEISGRGVGLAAMREACRALGGSLELESAASCGTVFRARIRTSRLAATP